MNNFDVAVEHVRSCEGGLVDNPADPGGRTNFGITQALLDVVHKAFPAIAPATVDQLQWSQAREVYRVYYWLQLRGDELPAGLSLAVLDAAVNSGVARAVKWLQQAAGVPADGWIGPRTLAAVRAANPAVLLDEFMARRAYHYMLQDATDDVFGLGWARRLIKTFRASL